jgi:chromosome segregation ATPase
MIKLKLHYIIVGIVGSVVASFIFATWASAQPSRHVPSSKVLEYSLMSLKKSAIEIEHKNRWLYSEIALYRESIDQLQKELSVLKRRKIHSDQGLLDPSDLEVDEEYPRLSIKDKTLAGLHDDILFLHKEQLAMEKKIKAKKSKKIAIQKEIQALRSEINHLTSNVKATETPKDYSIDPAEEAVLLASLEKSEQTLQSMELYIDGLKKEYGKPLEVMEELRGALNVLKQRYTILEDEYKIALEEEKKLKFEIDNIEKIQKQQLGLLEEEIKSLKKKGRHLERVLNRAERKLAGSNIALDPERIEIQEELLEDNLATIQKENQGLKSELAELQNTLKNKKK